MLVDDMGSFGDGGAKNVSLVMAVTVGVQYPSHKHIQSQSHTAVICDSHVQQSHATVTCNSQSQMAVTFTAVTTTVTYTQGFVF